MDRNQLLSQLRKRAHRCVNRLEELIQRAEEGAQQRGPKSFSKNVQDFAIGKHRSLRLWATELDKGTHADNPYLTMASDILDRLSRLEATISHVSSILNLRLRNRDRLWRIIRFRKRLDTPNDSFRIAANTWAADVWKSAFWH